MRSLLPCLGFALGALLAPAGGALGSAEPLTVVAVGTSLTEAIDWPQRLEARLSACSGGRPVRVERVAKSGMTSDWGLGQIERIAAFRPDILLIEFAINDANWRRLVSRERSRANTVAIAHEIRRRRPAVQVFLMTTNVVHGLRGLMRPSVGAYYDMYRKIAAAEDFGLIDLEPEWAKLSGQALRRAIPDGVHPTPEAFAEIALPTIVSALAGESCR
jgi:lysophospholipase L1-like esterase